MKHGVLILVEGPDGVGKSTVVRGLRKKANFAWHVIDRHVGSCYVYDAMFDRHPDHRRDHLGELKALKHVYDVYQVVLMRPLKDLVKVVGFRGDTFHTTAELQRQSELFTKWSRVSGEVVPTLLHLALETETPMDTVNAVASALVELASKSPGPARAQRKRSR